MEQSYRIEFGRLYPGSFIGKGKYNEKTETNVLQRVNIEAGNKEKIEKLHCKKV